MQKTVRKNKNYRFIVPCQSILRMNVNRNVLRMLPNKGEIFVKKNDNLSPADVIGECYISKGFRVFSISDILDIQPRDIGKYLKKELGSKVFKGEVLAERKKYLGSIAKQFIVPCDGVLENLNQDNGYLTVRFPPIKVRLLSGFYGTVEEIVDETGIKIKTQVHILKGQVGAGVVREGVFKIVPNVKETIDAVDINLDYSKKIILGGSLISRDIIQKAITLGVNGIIGYGINARDYWDLIGHSNPKEDVGISLLIIVGFGHSSIDSRVTDFLEKYKNKHAIMDPQKKELLIPLEPNEWKQKRKEKDKEAKELKVGDEAIIISWPYLGKKVKIIEIHKDKKRLNSQIETLTAMVSLNSNRKIILPLRNLELVKK